MKGIVLALGAFVNGCALTGPAPGGPLQGESYTQIQPSWAFAYGRASASVGGVQVSGDGQTQLVGKSTTAVPLPNPVPVTVGVRQQFGSFLEASADIGWVDSGAGLRVGLPSSAVAPVVLSAGARTGKVSAFGDDTYQGLFAVEVYPDISGARDGSLRLVLSLGLAAGAFEHQLSLPDSFESASDAPHGFPVASIVRREIRLQSSVGVTLRRPGGGVTVALSPWILLAAAAPSSSTCIECDVSPVISNFSQTWGLALLLVPYFGWGGGGR